MSKYCPEKGGPALYLECAECETRACAGGRHGNNGNGDKRERAEGAPAPLDQGPEERGGEALRGRYAEKILFGDRGCITTGASNDIERATKIIRSFVVNYGLVDEYGLLNLEVAEAPRGKVLDKEIELAKEIEAATDEMLGRTSTSSGQLRTSSLRTPRSTEKTWTESCRTLAPLRTARPPHRERGIARALLQM